MIEQLGMAAPTLVQGLRRFDQPRNTPYSGHYTYPVNEVEVKIVILLFVEKT